MAQQDDLFLLIKSLNKSEKRFITLSSGFQSGKKDYMELFHFLNKKDSYNERQIKTELSLSARKLTLAKSYLTSYILQSLRQYHAGLNKHTELSNSIHSINILMSKGLISHAARIIKKTKDSAIRMEYFPQLMDLLQIENLLYVRTHEFNEIKRNVDEVLVITKKYHQTREYFNVFYKVLEIQNTNFFARKDENEQELKKLENLEILNTDFNATSLTSKMMRLIVKYIIGRIRGDVLACKEHSENLLKLLDGQSEFIQARPNYYISIAMGALSSSYQLNDFVNCIEIAKKVRSELSEQIPLELRGDSYISSYISQIHSEIYLGKTQTLPERLNKLKERINEFLPALTITNQLVALYQVSYASYLLQDYKSAIKYLNDLLFLAEKSTRTDIQSYAYILQLIIHYERGNFDNIEHYVRAAYRFLKSRDHLFSVEKVIIKSMRKLPDVNDQEMFKAFCQNLLKELTAIMDDPDTKKSLQYFDFVSWVESKLNNEKMISRMHKNAPTLIT